LTEVFRDDFERMPVWNVVLGTLVDGGMVGVVLALACRFWAPRPRAWFVGLAAAGALASFSLPIVSDGTTATKVVLSVMHVVAACLVVPMLASALPKRRVAR
jgi:hypothetical protein